MAITKERTYQQEYYHTNKDKIKNYPSRKSPDYTGKLKTYRDNLKAEVITHYSPDSCCIKCGFSDMRALCIDHINGDGKHRSNGISGYRLYCWLKKNNFPEGFQVLCANCNLIKQHEAKEWRKRNG